MRVQNRIRALIAASGWSLAEFARQMGVTPQRLNGWINRGGLIPVDMAIRAALLTDTHIMFIYQGVIDSRIDPEFRPKLIAELKKMGEL